MKTPVLVLNADMTPLSTVRAQKAFRLLFKDDPVVNVVDYYNKKIHDTVGRSYPIPAVIAILKYVHVDYQTAKLTKRNIFARDQFTCQYCGFAGSPSELTLDHIIPQSWWKKKDKLKNLPKTPNRWDNLVTCCVSCNRKKGDRTPEQAGFNLRSKPKAPRHNDPRFFCADANKVPDEWSVYLQHK